MDKKNNEYVFKYLLPDRIDRCDSGIELFIWTGETMDEAYDQFLDFVEEYEIKNYKILDVKRF